MNRRQHDDAQAFDEAWNSRAHTPRAQWDEEVALLVSCAEQLCESAVIEPSAEFRSSLRTQLMTEAATALAPTGTRPARSHRPQVYTPSAGFRRRLAGATAALVTAGGFVGLVGASAQALPGEMLYPVKRGVENVELAFHKDDPSRGEFRLNQASERLAEARRLTESGAPQSNEHVAGALDDFAEQAKDGSGALFRSYGQNGSSKDITAVNDFSATAATDLAQLSGKVPSDADQSFQTAAITVSELVTKASSLCTSCGTADVSGIAGAVSSLGGGSQSTSQLTGPTTGTQQDPTPEIPVDQEVLPDTPKITIPSLTPGTSGQSGSPQQGSSNNAPKLTDVTDPIVGSLLGDDEQPGLVGGLVDGLLGGGQQ